MAEKLLTIVMPVYNEEESLPLLFQALGNFISGFSNINIEVIFVDDHSKDSSPKILEEFCKNNPTYKFLRLSKKQWQPHRSYCWDEPCKRGLRGIHGIRPPGSA